MEIVYFELNNWFPGRDYPDAEPFNSWINTPTYTDAFEDNDWCIENNRMDLNDRFDEEKNGCTTKEVGYKSNLKWWFKCPRGLHDSDQYFMCFVTNDPHRNLICRKCNSVAQVVIDRFGEDYLNIHWHKDNVLSPWEIPAGSAKIKIIVQCNNKDYHVYEQAASSFAKGIGCPYCINRKVHPNDSLAVLYPEVIDKWSDKNDTRGEPYMLILILLFFVYINQF